MPHLTMPMDADDFRRLPRNGAYHYRYRDGIAFLTPVAVYYRASLDLLPFAGIEVLPSVALRPPTDADQPVLAELFAAAFEHVQPFGSLQPETRQAAARTSVRQTLRDGDGPLIRDASFVAVDERGEALGAILITLVPPEGPAGEDSYVWNRRPPADAVLLRLGRPHITWVFVPTRSAGKGIGSALLYAAVEGLLRLGYTELVSTFILGNDSSMLWHWHHGFRLLPRTQHGD